MKKILSLTLALLTALSLMATAWAVSVVKPNDDFYYYDDAGVLSEATCGEIVFANDKLYEATGAQFVVAAVKTIGNADTADYAAEMLRSWGIGDANKNNGFLLLMAIDEDDYYYCYGSGLTKLFDQSDLLGKIQDEYLEPAFAAKDYDKAARGFFEQVFNSIASWYGQKITYEDGIAGYQAYIASETEEIDRPATGANEIATTRANTTSGRETGTGTRLPVAAPVTGSNKGGIGVGGVIVVIVLLVILVAVLGGRRRRRMGGGPVVVPMFFGRRRAPRPPRPPRPPMGQPMGGGPRPTAGRPMSSRPVSSRPSGSLFGGGRSGGGSRSSFGGGRSGGFGGGRVGGGGGRSFGGGGGRGRR